MQCHHPTELTEPALGGGKTFAAVEDHAIESQTNMSHLSLFSTGAGNRWAEAYVEPPITRSSRGSGARAPKVPKVEVEDLPAVPSSRDLILQVQPHAPTLITISRVRPAGLHRACQMG